jgi:hypothetical protein
VGPIHAQNLLATMAVGDGVQRQGRSSVPHFHGTVVAYTGQIKLTVVAPSYTGDLCQKKKSRQGKKNKQSQCHSLRQHTH